MRPPRAGSRSMPSPPCSPVRLISTACWSFPRRHLPCRKSKGRNPLPGLSRFAGEGVRKMERRNPHPGLSRLAGAELVPINTLQDEKLPEVDALLIGGGFPEVFMEQLEANVSLRRDIRQAIEAGMPAYAECGGLMSLPRSLSWQGQRCEMAGVIPGDVVMHARPMGRGYVVLRWPC